MLANPKTAGISGPPHQGSRHPSRDGQKKPNYIKDGEGVTGGGGVGRGRRREQKRSCDEESWMENPNYLIKSMLYW